MLTRPFYFFVLLALHLSSQVSFAQNNYWQQRVDTRIDVRLDDENHILHGYEELIYTNNSPDTLRSIWMHIWPNAYKNDRSAFATQQIENFSGDFYYAHPNSRGYLDSLQFQVNGVPADYYTDAVHEDIIRLDLPLPLLPGSSIELSTPFRVKLPEIFSRLGHNGQSYAISQWFPKPAVYDSKGWHQMPYLDQGEFYSEFGNYDVFITLPEHYVVIATGNLETESEKDWLSQRAQTTYVPDSLNTSSSALKTIHFNEKHVHDFAWFADKRYQVMQRKVAYGKDSVLLQTASFDKSKSWNVRALDDLQKTLDSFTQWIGPYPYKSLKALQGKMPAGGGMEYPTVTIIDEGSEYNSEVIIHEAGHNWFYGLLGSNERQHPWMDEGINTYYENRLLQAISKRSDTNKSSSLVFSVDLLSHYFTALGKSQSLKLPSTDYHRLNYGVDVYYRTAALFRYLESYLGKDRFDAGMQWYYKNWALKHPQPEDLQHSLEQQTGMSLNWFFKDLLTYTGKLNTGISSVHEHENNYQVEVYNNSDIALPSYLAVYKNDLLLHTYRNDPFKGAQTISIQDLNDKPTHFVFQQGLADYRNDDNRYELNGHKGMRSGISLGAQIDQFDGFNLSLLPAVGINHYDGFMLGLFMHNLSLPQKQFQYAIAPMYAFKAKSWAAAGTVGYIFLPSKNFRQIIAQMDFKSFHKEVTSFNSSVPMFARYSKVAPGLTFVVRESDARKPLHRALQLRGYGIREEFFNYHLDPSDSLYKPRKNFSDKWYALLSYTHRHDRMVNPFGYKGELQAGSSFAKFKLEGDVKISYHTPKKGLYVRGFFGKFFHLTSNHLSNDRYFLNSTFTGANDYLYDGIYFGRSEREGILSRQFELQEGGESIPTPLYAQPLGRSDNWLAAINIRTDLPFDKIPLRLYFNTSTFAQAQYLLPSGNKLLYSGGLQLYALDEVFLLQVPLVKSRDYQDYYNSIIVDKKFLRSISFSINLHRTNLMRAHEWLGELLSKQI